MSDNALIIFAKAPEPERVKTRLASVLSPKQRLRLYQWLLDRTVSELSSTMGYDTFICYTPVGGKRFFERYDLKVFPQRNGDLGQRMKAAFEAVFREDYKKAVIVGVDVPELTVSVVEKAFQGLCDVDIVFGPSVDGGYYLVGMCPPVKDIFSGVRWSTQWTLSDSLTLAKSLGLKVHLLEALRDIDEPRDLLYLKERFNHEIPSTS